MKLILERLKGEVGHLFLRAPYHFISHHPELRERLLAKEVGLLDNFINEVRRFYPFFPSLIAKVKRNFEWKHFKFKEGMTAMLDIYGTHHDDRVWEFPEEFNPDRFKNRDLGPYDFFPQGMGDHFRNH